MPTFLNATTAAAAAAIVIPSLLLLYFLKLRRREFPVPSTLLWRKSIQDLQVNSPFQKLRKNLLLFLQLLLLLLLTLALSRPVMNYSPGAGKLAVIMIDRSASMSAQDQENHKTRLDEAKKQAKELVDTMDKNSQAMVIAFDDSADIVRSFTNDRTILKSAIDSIQPTHRLSRLKTAYQLAEAKALAFFTDQLRAVDQTKPEIWLYSDGRVADRNELSLRVAELKKYTKIGSDNADNVGIVAMNSKRNYERPSEVQVFVRLANYGAKPAKASLQLSVDGAVPPGGVRRDLLLLPERWENAEREKYERDNHVTAAQGGAEFKLDLLKGAAVRVELKDLPTDVLGADDSAQIIVPPPRSLRVALVSREGNYWLDKFIASADLKDPQTLAPEEYESKMKDPQALATAYDVIIFDRYQPPALPPAGNFIYFAAIPPNTKLTVAKDAQGPILYSDETVLDWDHNHPILRGLNVSKLFFLKTLKLQLPSDAQMLIEGRQGPLAVLYREARHTHLVFAFDIDDTTWKVAPSFPIFMDNALQYLAIGSDMDIRQSFQPGATPKIPRFNLQQARGDLKELTITGPPGFDKVVVPITETGDFALPPLDHVGIYTLSPPIPQFEQLAVNLLDENESNLLPIDDPPGATAATEKSTAAGRSRFELWWWIVACCAVPLCLVEWWVYTRRMHL
jgi:hypothetical protein